MGGTAVAINLRMGPVVSARNSWGRWHYSTECSGMPVTCLIEPYDKESD